jgi:hypothetical protein
MLNGFTWLRNGLRHRTKLTGLAMNKCYCNDPTCGNNHDIEEINDAEDIAGELEYERIKSEDDRDNQ